MVLIFTISSLVTLPTFHSHKWKTTTLQLNEKYSHDVEIYDISTDQETVDHVPIIPYNNIDDIKQYFGLNRTGACELITEDVSFIRYEPLQYVPPHCDFDTSTAQLKRVGTMLVIPPKCLCNYQGGHLVVEGTIIPIADTMWTVVVFSLFEDHQVTRITDGHRHVLKCKLYVNIEH